MTAAERLQIADSWMGRYCVHPRFEDVVDQEPTGRACVQCGEWIEDIVRTATHTDLFSGG